LPATVGDDDRDGTLSWIRGGAQPFPAKSVDAWIAQAPAGSR
jgi:hypothetical protein